MSYSVNPTVFRSIFAVPTSIVDDHIRVANAEQLKVLLWILRNSPENPDIEKMCEDIKIDIADAPDYLDYWKLTGILQSNGETPKFTSPPKTASPKKDVNSTAVTEAEDNKELTRPSKPSSYEIATRIEESPEIGHLFQEAQAKLGKTVGYEGQCTLLLLHDHYGLPTEVLFMLIDYCVSVGKVNYSYIQTVGKDWGLREIDTLEKAAEQITELKNVNSLWKSFAAATGISNPRPTNSQIPFLKKWINDMKFSLDMIVLAYEEMANHTGKLNFKYIDRILTTWYEKKWTTPEKLENGLAQERLNSGPKPAKTSKSKNSLLEISPSYDLDKFEQQSIHGELKYDRKKKKKDELFKRNTSQGDTDT
ncbi:MAG: DnaD domain protein [Clostridia bacterium]|nr:DnaD domain protein [Clostridia bacterium]